MEYNETFIFDVNDEEGVLVEHKAMLYLREIGNDDFGYLLLSAEDNGDGGSIVLVVGHDLREADFTVYTLMKGITKSFSFVKLSQPTILPLRNLHLDASILKYRSSILFALQQ